MKEQQKKSFESIKTKKFQAIEASKLNDIAGGGPPGTYDYAHNDIKDPKKL